MKRVLIVAYYFPPAGGIGSLRATGFARYLPEFGWEPVVLAPRDPSYHHDPDLAVPPVEVIRTRSLDLSRAGKRALRAGGDATVPADVSGVRGSLQEAARRLLYYPDAQVGWYPYAAAAGRRAQRNGGIDAILSTSFPITAHLVARRLHRTFRVPWVADFRDPWSLRLPEGSTVRRRAVALERRLAAEASRVVTVSPSWGRLFGQRWGRPVDVVPNGHELDLDQLAARSAPDELVVGYLGTYYPATQDLTGVWAALATLGSSARVRVIGAANRVLGQQLDAVGLGDRLDVSGFVGQGRVLEELGRCSVLLLAGPTDADPVSRGVVAGKVWEYLATGLPILYVGDETCDIAALLAEQPGCALHASQDVAGIAESLRALRGQTYARDTDNISRRARSGQLAGILEHAVS